jgi:TonB family protein
MAVVVATSLLARPPAGAAQERPAELIRVKWDVANLLVYPDSNVGVILWVATNARAEIDGRRAEREMVLRFHPDTLRDWLIYTHQLLALEGPPIAGDTSSIVTSGVLTGSGGAGIAVARRRVKQRLDRKVRVVIAPPAHGQLLLFELERPAVDSLLSALEAVEPKSRYRPEHNDSLGGTAHVERAAEPTGRRPHLQYPDEAQRDGREGEVWVRFVVGPDGRVDLSTVQALLSDGDDFEQAVRAYLRNARFLPAVADGQPVKALMAQRFVFAFRR